MDHLSLGRKMITTSISILFIVAILLSTIINKALDEIALSQEEQVGMEIVETIQPLYLQIQKIRSLVNLYRNRNTTIEQEMFNAMQETQRLIDNIKRIIQSSHLKILITDINKIENTIVKLNRKAAKESSARNIFKEYNAITREIFTLIQKVADKSTLSIIPDIDMSYLVKTTSYSLPLLEDYVTQVQAKAIGAASKSRAARHTKKDISTLISIIQDNLINVDLLYKQMHKKINKELKKPAKNAFNDSLELTYTIDNEIMYPSRVSISAEKILTQGELVMFTIETLRIKSMKLLHTFIKQRNLDSKHALYFYLGMSLFFITLIALLNIGFYHSTRDAIYSIKNCSHDIATNKDLTLSYKIESKDEMTEISNSLNTLLSSVQDTVNDAKNSSSKNSEISMRLAHSSQTIISNVNEERNIVKQTVLMANDIKTVITGSIDDSQNTATNIEAANNTLNGVQKNIVDMSQSIHTVVEKENELSSKLNQLTSDADEVKIVLTVISDIADQTNLLALNAAIEAARAGEHGRGFAVVADEVRKLAERTQHSLSEINATINIIVQAIEDASNTMRMNAKFIDELSATSTEVNQNITEVSSVMGKANNTALQSSNQAQSIAGQITSLINQIHLIDDSSSDNEHRVEDIQNAASMLNTLASELKGKLDTFVS